MKPFRYILVPLTLLLAGCPGDEWKPKWSPEEACEKVSPLALVDNHRTITMAPGETMPLLPLQGPGGFLNSPTSGSSIPKTVKYYGLDGIGATQELEPKAKPPFSASITAAGISVGASNPQDGSRDVVEQEVKFWVQDKCAAILKDDNRGQTITLRLVMDPSRKPLTEAEKQQQLRKPAAGSAPASLAEASAVEAGVGGATNTAPATEPEATAPFDPHQKAEAAPAE